MQVIFRLGKGSGIHVCRYIYSYVHIWVFPECEGGPNFQIVLIGTFRRVSPVFGNPHCA